MENWNWSKITFYLHYGIALFFLLRILWRQHNRSVAVAWIMVVFALPLMGVLAYILLGEVNIGRQYLRRNQRAQQLFDDFAQSRKLDFSRASQTLPVEFKQLSHLAEVGTGLGVYDQHTLTLLDDTESIFISLLADIEHAKHTILLEFYIIEVQGRVELVIDALIRAVNRGVACQLLLDSVGSHAFLRSKQRERMERAGIQIYQSLSVNLFTTLIKRSDIRNHRKLAVFDNQFGYIGSFNLVDPNFFKQSAKVGKWIDMMIRVESQQPVSVVQGMSMVVSVDIGAERVKSLSRFRQFVIKFNDRRESMRNWFGKDTPPSTTPLMNLKKIQPYFRYPSVSHVSAQLIPSAPALGSSVVYETLISAIFMAKQQIIITTPYFVPDDGLLLALVTAAKKGVNVVLNIPKTPDSRLVRFASSAYFAPLLDAGVQIALFERGLLHTKLVVIDEAYALFGTVNMDMRSFFINLEVMLAIYDKTMVSQLITCQRGYLADSVWVNKDYEQQRTFLGRTLDRTIRLLSPLL